jgi:hypothetical protein
MDSATWTWPVETLASNSAIFIDRLKVTNWPQCWLDLLKLRKFDELIRASVCWKRGHKDLLTKNNFWIRRKPHEPEEDSDNFQHTFRHLVQNLGTCANHLRGTYLTPQDWAVKKSWWAFLYQSAWTLQVAARWSHGVMDQVASYCTLAVPIESTWSPR